MIFARRSIQRMLDALEGIFSPPQLETLVGRLNENDVHSLGAEWEVLVLWGLSRLGHVSHEPPLGGSSKVDVFFQLADDPTAQFAADITSVSDQSLEDANPVDELMELIRRKAHRLGIPPGGFDHRVKSQPRANPQKQKVRLKMPQKKDLHRFLETRITPALKAIAREPGRVSTIVLHDEQHDIQISYRPGTSYSSAGYPSFRHAAVIDSNPLYNRLDEKRKQLKDSGYAGPKGIIVCDGGCQTLTSSVTSWDSFSKAQIVAEFFRQSTEVSFVLLLWIDRPHRQPGEHNICTSRVVPFLNPRAAKPLPPAIQNVLGKIADAWPRAVQNAENARIELRGRGSRKAREQLGHSFWGGHQMSGRHFRMSARSLMEILAGRTSQAEFDEAHGFAVSGASRLHTNPFEFALKRGLTIGAVKLEHIPDEDDDWIEFQFSGPDPAIAPYRPPRTFCTTKPG